MTALINAASHAVRPTGAMIVLCVLAIAARQPTQAASPDLQQAELQKIAPGGYQCFFLVGGDVVGIGSNRCGQLGFGTGAPYPPAPPVPIQVPPQTKFIDVVAAGYHSLAVDSTGHVWTWGSNRYGQRGDGSPLERDGVPAPPEYSLPNRIAHDSQGHDFDGVIRVCGGWWIDGALKSDGTIWVWGKNSEETNGLAGSPEVTSATLDRPTQVPFDEGVSIVELATSGAMMVARDTAGRVWSWGGGVNSSENRGSGQRDFTKPCLLPNLPEIRTIAIGDGFSYALDGAGNLWGWGLSGTYLGLGPAQGGWFPQPTPVKLSFPEFGGTPVAAVAVSGHSTHVILTDGTLWGWGDSAMGEVGNGEMLDFAPRNYSWDWGKFERMVFRPVRIAPDVHNFAALYSTAMCFYTYAVTQDGQIYSWGRNKTGILGNGVIPTGDVAAHPDSWNVPTATRVSPFSQQGIREVPAKP
jgi:alpha-tubulin suppressor-like RCC1 family protein